MNILKQKSGGSKTLLYTSWKEHHIFTSVIKQTNKGNIKHNSFQILQGHVLAYVAEF